MGSEFPSSRARAGNLRAASDLYISSGGTLLSVGRYASANLLSLGPTRSQLNPVAFAFHTIDRYRASVLEGLRAGGLSAEGVRDVWPTLTTDRGVILSKAPAYARHDEPLREFCARLGLHARVADQFGELESAGLYAHQAEAIESLVARRPTVVATGTGSGKTETFLVPVLEACLRAGDEGGVRAVLVYPMNALAGDQLGRLERALQGTGAHVGLYTGDTARADRQAMHDRPPQVLVTNPVMLDRLVTMPGPRQMFQGFPGALQYVVLDELHTYAGSRGVHLRALLARLAEVSGSPFVPVGTSATLRRSGGYFDDAQERALWDFLSGSLRVEPGDITLVEPKVEPDTTPVGPSPRHAPDAEYGWDAQLGRLQEVAGLLGSLLGAPVDFTELYGPDAPALTALREAPFTRALSRRLNGGSLPFAESVDLFRAGYRAAHGDEPARAEEVVKSYLRLFAYFGETGRSVLDLRFHVFLRNAGGTLHRCMTCDRHHAGHSENCPECGGLLFAVDQAEPRACLAKVTLRRTGGDVPVYRLTPRLSKQEEDPQAVLYVRLYRAPAAPAGALHVHIDPAEEGASLRAEAGAPWALVLEPDVEEKGALDRTVSLVTDKAEHAYLCAVAQTLLEVQHPVDSKRLLAFVDSRERAAQYAHVSQDYFADAFFAELLRRALGDDPDPVSLPDAYSAFRDVVEDVGALGDGTRFHGRALADGPLWFARFALTRRQDSRALPPLALDLPSDLGEAESWLANEMLEQRLVLRSFVGATADKFQVLRFGGYSAHQQAGLYARGGGGTDRDDRDDRSASPAVRSVALTEDARTFRDGLKRFGLPDLVGALDKLTARNVVRTFETPDGKRHYALSPDLVRLVPGALSEGTDGPLHADHSLRQLRDEMLVRAEAHTADCEAQDRRAVERDFRGAGPSGDGEPLPLLFATPTLEMGVDIGGLSAVLMAGVPPSPSNYAQRAGRAGRREQRSALIVTFCSSARSNDAFYFAHPPLMIDGAVTPPAADMGSPAIVRRHANALVLADLVERGEVAAFLADPELTVDLWAHKLGALFGTPGRPFDGADHLRTWLPGRLRSWITEDGASGVRLDERLLNSLYRSPLFPDHEFRRESVALRPDPDDPDTTAGLRDHPDRPAPARGSARGRGDGALSTYVPELALVNLALNRRVFLPSGRFTVVAPSAAGSYGPLDARPGEGPPSVRDYARGGLLARAVRDFGPRERDGTGYATAVWVDGPTEALLERGPVSVRFSYGATVRFENHGRRTFGGVQWLTDDEGSPFTLAYELTGRDAVVVEMDAAVLEPRSYPVNLASALFRAIVEQYGLAESEVALVFDVVPWAPGAPTESDGPPRWRFALLDVAGNGSVPLRRVGEDAVRLASVAYARLTTCACERGCYLCLRTGATNREAHLLDKGLARDLVGYLAGREECPTEILLPAPPRPPDATRRARGPRCRTGRRGRSRPPPSRTTAGSRSTRGAGPRRTAGPLAR